MVDYLSQPDKFYYGEDSLSWLGETDVGDICWLMLEILMEISGKQLLADWLLARIAFERF